MREGQRHDSDTRQEPLTRYFSCLQSPNACLGQWQPSFTTCSEQGESFAQQLPPLISTSNTANTVCSIRNQSVNHVHCDRTIICSDPYFILLPSTTVQSFSPDWKSIGHVREEYTALYSGPHQYHHHLTLSHSGSSPDFHMSDFASLPAHDRPSTALNGSFPCLRLHLASEDPYSSYRVPSDVGISCGVPHTSSLAEIRADRCRKT